jgi:hypothetical protein
VQAFCLASAFRRLDIVNAPSTSDAVGGPPAVEKAHRIVAPQAKFYYPANILNDDPKMLPKWGI